MNQIASKGEHLASNARAVVLGIEHPRGLAALRSLARARIPVVVVEHEARTKGSYSRYLDHFVPVGDDPADQLAALERLGRDGGGVLIPTNDHYLMLVSQNHDRLARWFTLTTPPWEILGPVVDKAQAYQIADRAGIPTPTFFQPRDVEDLRRIIQELDLANQHYLLKCRVGGEPADRRSGRFTKVPGASAAAIEQDCLEIFSRAGEFPMIEQVVPAEADRCIGVAMVVDHEHRPAISFCIRRLKLFTYSRGGDFVHPYELGANVYCESVHDREATKAAERFVMEARYVGPVTVEFRRSSIDDRLTFVKADPRFVRATSLSTALGLDMPTAVHRLATGRSIEPSDAYPDHYAWIWLVPYVRTLWRHRDNRAVRRELIGLVRNLRNIKAAGYLDWRDPMPFLVDVWWLLKSTPRRVRRLTWRRKALAPNAP